MPARLQRSEPEERFSSSFLRQKPANSADTFSPHHMKHRMKRLEDDRQTPANAGFFSRLLTCDSIERFALAAIPPRWHARLHGGSAKRRSSFESVCV